MSERDLETLCTFLCRRLNRALLCLLTHAGRQVSQRLAEEARKRERFEELKQHLEQEQEVRMCEMLKYVTCVNGYCA